MSNVTVANEGAATPAGSARAGKLLPPAADAGRVVPRPALEARLEEGATRRLTVLVAGAGFGKSTLAARLTETRPAAWYTVDVGDRHLGTLVAGIVAALRRRLPQLPEELAAPVEGAVEPKDDLEAASRAQAAAALVCDALQLVLEEDLLLVVDDVQALDDAPAAWRFIEGLVRLAPPELHVVVVSRTEPPFAIERLRGQGQVADIGGPALAFTAEEIEAVLAAFMAGELSDDERRDVAARITAATGGWPAAVRLAVEAYRTAAPGSRAGELDRLQHPDGPLFSYLAEEVVSRAPEATRDLIRRAVHFDRFTAGLCLALGIEDADRILAELGRRALFLQTHPEGGGWYTLHGLIREYTLARLPLPAAEIAELHRRAAAWFEAAGLLDLALRSWVESGSPEGLSAFLDQHALTLVLRGSTRAVTDAAASLPPELRGPAVENACGEGHLAHGNWRAAAGCFDRAQQHAGRLDAATGWRMGMVHALRGAYGQAMEVYERAERGHSGPEDEALLDAYIASTHYHLGNAEGSRTAAQRSLDAAQASGSARAEAAARTAMGMSRELDGDTAGAVAQYTAAQAAAERAGDGLQEVRIRSARGALEIDGGRFAEAVETLDGAVRLAEAVGFASFHARALTHRGRAKQGTGRFEEALADLVAARGIYDRIGSPSVVYPLTREGSLHALRGDGFLARSAFEAAVRTAREARDNHALAQALIGLAQVVAPDDPDAAREMAEEAVAIGRDTTPMSILLGASRVALTLGDRETARARAVEVTRLAEQRGDLPATAAGKELQALVADDRAAAARLVAEAAAIWAVAPAPYGAARNRLIAARVLGGEEARTAAREAEQAFRALGARGPAGEAAALLDELDRATLPPLTIQALGRFRVLRDGDPVPATAWQSKKARDLLKILVARRGRPTTRETFFELLWPDEDPAPLGNRLSVALATVRGVLDPERRFPAEHFIAADKTAISLDLDHVDLDVERFRVEAAAGARLLRSGDRPAAIARFEAAEALYAGDFLEEDPYEDWAVGLREEAQATYIAVARTMAGAAAERGDADGATRFYLRILERDPYDEGAHLGLVAALVAAGRHGEARRRYGFYASKMAEIAVEAAPFPAVRRADPARGVAVAAG